MINHFVIPRPLNLTGDIFKNWENFTKDFNKFAKAYELDSKSEEIKLAIFLNLIGKDAVEIVKTFKFDCDDKDKSFSKITLKMVMDAFKNYCIVRKNVTIYNSCKFQERRQYSEEGFDQYLKSIIELAKFCKFECEERMLRDRIITGVKDLRLQEALITMQDITLANVIQHCKEFELKNNCSEILGKEEIYLLSYKSVKCKEVNENGSNVNNYCMIDLKNLVDWNDNLIKGTFRKENNGLMAGNSHGNVQCVPKNLDMKQNLSKLPSEAVKESQNVQNNKFYEGNTDVKTKREIKLNPMSKLGNGSSVQPKKCNMIRWNDIVSYCSKIPGEVNFLSNKSNTGKDCVEINQCFNSKQEDEVKIIEHMEDLNFKPDIIYSEIPGEADILSNESNTLEDFVDVVISECFNMKPEDKVKKIEHMEDLNFKPDIIFSEIPGEVDFLSNESNILEDFVDIVISECFNSKPEDEVKKNEHMEDLNPNPVVLYSDILKNRLRKSNRNDLYKCQKCNQGFSYKNELSIHKKTCSSINREKEKRVKIKNPKREIKKELKNNKRIFKCDKCDKSFFYKCRLEKHNSQHHFEENTFNCSECFRKFASSRGLKVHSSSMHKRQRK